jgi:hypothetical protein
MEIALITGAIALLGNEISKNKQKINSVKEKQELLNPSTELQENQQSAEDLVNNFHDEIENHMKDPLTYTRIKTDENMVPFFRGERTQNLNDDLLTRKLATFTGENNIDFQHKREVIMEPPVRDVNNVHGVTFQPDIERYKNYVATFPHNNVSSTERIQVGPGLGIPTDQSAAGGFHQFFRILPENVGGYKKNNLPGTMNHGGSRVEHRQASDFDFNLNRPHLDPMGQTCRAFDNKKYVNESTPMLRPDMHSSLCYKRGQENCFTGSANQSGLGNYVVDSDGYTHTDTKLFVDCYNGNPQAAYIGTGAYQHENFLETSTGNRDMYNCESLNLNRAGAGTYQFAGDIVPTQRGNMCHDNVYGHAQHAGAAQYSTMGFDTIQPTQRGQCNEHILGAYATSGSMNRAQVDQIRETQRGKETTCANTGGAGAMVSAAPLYKDTYNNHDTFMKKELTLVEGYTPNELRTNIALGSDEIGCNTRVFKQEQCNDILTHGVSKGANNFTDSNQIGTINVGNKLPVENTRTVFGYIPDQLKDNPYAIKSFHT